MNLEDLRNSQGEVWLNVASSSYPIEEFANLDNHIFLTMLAYPFLLPLVPKRNQNLLQKYREATQKAKMHRHDCRKPLPLPDGSVDHILCSHFLEHVFPDETTKILTDFQRVLKKGATAHIIVPDIAVQIDKYKAEQGKDPQAADNFLTGSLLSKKDRGSLKYRIMEFGGGFGLQHRWMYDQASMEAKIADIGFEIVPENETPSAEWRKDDGISVHVVARKR
ncbi:MAG: class I SAM-dependent methyltransferase [Pseudomonadota bacterium]